MHTPLTFEECEAVLLSQHYGHLGCSDDNRPFVFPVTYAYRNGSLYSFTHEGTKMDLIRKNPHVCLQVEHVKTGYEWESVLCHGMFQEVTDAVERHDIELLLAEQYAAISLRENKVPVSPVIEELHLETVKDIKKSVVYRIDILQTTGVRGKPHE